MLRPGSFPLVWVGLWCLTVADVAAQSGHEELLRRIEQANSGLKDYTVQLDVDVDLERLKVPSMHVTMYFKAPDKVHFSSEGFALLPKESMSLGPAQLRSRFDIVSATDTVDGAMKLSKLELKRRDDKTGLHRVYAYVDQEHWLIRRIVSPGLDGRSIIADFHHLQVQGFWLPSELAVRFTSAPSDTSAADPLEQLGPIRRAQLPRQGKITIRYSDYNINAGLDDAVFEKKAGEK